MDTLLEFLPVWLFAAWIIYVEVPAVKEALPYLT